MRTLRFSAFFVSALFCLTGWSQTPQTAPAQQPAATQTPDKSQPQEQPPAPNTQLPFPVTGGQNQQPVDTQQADKFKLKFLPIPVEPKQKKLPTGIVDRGFRAAIEYAMRRPQLKNVQEEPQEIVPPTFQGDFDPGIRIDTTGANVCGAIVSYNFSRSARGETPKLESVTTCTPANKVIQQRTRHKDAKPTTPQLLQTVFPQ